MPKKQKEWICVRQRAGPLVKECRAIRPRLSRYDSPYERSLKNKILRPSKDSSVCRTPTDRVELMLAQFGFDGVSYVLEWPDEFRPKTYKDLRKWLDGFVRRMRRRLGHEFDYLYRIEGLHGKQNYHIHMTVSYNDLPYVVMEDACKEIGAGVTVEYGRPLLKDAHDSYRRTAIYYTKEKPDGIKIPVSGKAWGYSNSLRKKLPPPEHFTSDTGQIDFPEHPRACGRSTVDNAFGHYHYGWYIKQDPRHFVS